ncbi:MAG: RNA methyltransferase [Ignavibacteria bacterium]|nr:RNA methyltransferase [Ignavibacteria bacterium]
MTNSEVKYYSSLKIKKYREIEKKFLIEGKHLVEECLASPYKNLIEKIIIRNDFGSPDLDVSPFEVSSVTEKDFNKLSDTVNPQGIAAVVKMPEQSSRLISDNLVIALENVNDPGNLGTIIRTAYWFGINDILVSSNSADVYNSKTLRSSQGAVFHTKLHLDVNLSEKLSGLQPEGYKVLLTDLDTENILSEYTINKQDKYVLVFGSEANGISDDLKRRNFERIKIEGYSPCESLNLAVSAGILMRAFKASLK